MSLGNWEGLDGARVERLSEAISEEEEWFSGVAIESSTSGCSARSAYSEELPLSLEKNMLSKFVWFHCSNPALSIWSCFPHSH